MRIIITILLFICLNAEGQVIRANAYYRPFAQAQLLLDQYTGAAAAYSLRKLRTAYTGAAIRVRKDTTGQPEIDISFVGNDLDTVALKSFINARDAYVVTWYDQSGNGRNATQTVQANQPRIALTGVIERSLSKPSIQFNSHLLQVTMTGIDTVTRLQTYNVVNPALAAAADVNSVILWGYAGGGGSNTLANRGIQWGAGTSVLGGERFGMYFTNATISTGRLGNSTYSRSANTTTLFITENRNNGTSWYTNGGTSIGFNQTFDITTSTNTSPSNCATTSTSFWIKSTAGATNAVAQKYSELIIYYNTNRDYQQVSSQINAYYGIY